MINEFVLISPRGDTLVSKSYRGKFSASETSDIFLRNIRNEEARPIFIEEGVIYVSIKLNGMYFVFSSTSNEAPAFLLEHLERISRVFKDYCGVLTEESIRRNFLLLYELLDEILDFGYPQGTATEMLKAYVYNEPAPVDASAAAVTQVVAGAKTLQNFLSDKKTMSSASANRPITMSDTKSKENVVFVDIVEKISVALDKKGSVIHSIINGQILLKSFLTGSPEMRLGLNEDLVIRSLGIRGLGGSANPSLPLSDANFHECVRWNEQAGDPSFSFYAPDGEFTLMSYRINSAFRPPFSCVPFLEQQGPNAVDFVVRLRGEFPADKSAVGVVLQFSVPPSAASCSLETATSLGASGSSGKAEFDRNKRIVKWVLPAKVAGNAEYLIRAKILLNPGVKAGSITQKHFGTLNLQCDVPMYLCSGISIRYLDFTYNSGSSQPNKWIRYLTQAASFTVRM